MKLLEMRGEDDALDDVISLPEGIQLTHASLKLNNVGVNTCIVDLWRSKRRVVAEFDRWE